MNFIFKESFKLIARSKLNFVLNLISLTICVILIVISFFILKTSDYLQNYIQKNISLSIFIKDNSDQRAIEDFKKRISEKPYSSSVEFISKEKAAEIFLKETGEDFKKILDYNPLPTSFNLYLNKNYTLTDSVKNIISEIEKESIVSEVVSKMEFLQKVLALLTKMRLYIFVFTGFMLLVSVYLVFSTVKLIMNSKYEELETMKLVGAKLSTIKLPILFNIIFVGLIAGIISLTIFYFVMKVFLIDKNILLGLAGFDLNLMIIFTLLIGPFIGIIVTIIALRKISLRI